MRHAILLALLVATAGCSGGEDEGNGGTPTALVKLAPASRSAISESVTLYGEVERGGQNQAMLVAPVEAQVEAITAPAGSAVRAGQLVARLKPSPASAAQIASAKADAASAEQALARANRLKADGLASDADVETARAAAAGASALARSLAQRVGQLALRAPHAGYVETVGASPGDLVQAGTVIATLSGTGSMQARFGIDPALARKLKPGSALRIEPSDGSANFSVPIKSVSLAADPQTRLGSVSVSIPASRHLAPGLPLTAEAQVASVANVVTVPYSALLDDGGQPYVFVVSKGVAHRKDVQTGPTGGDRVAILKGLADGEIVVTVGNSALEDGMKVRTK
jgi:RND family efflux transporter MFP subunit